MHSIRVTLDKSGYDILVERGLIDKLGSHMKQYFNTGKVLMITDTTVNDLYGGRVIRSLTSEGIQVGRITLPNGSRLQTLESIRAIHTAMMEFQISAQDGVLLLGGGMLQEVASVAVSSRKRGVKLIYLPTTLMGMLDCSVGGKTALGSVQGKNIIGSFCPPHVIFIDPNAAYSLTDSHFGGGMGEAIKLSCAFDASLFHLLDSLNGRSSAEGRLSEIVCRCISLKRQALERGERSKLLMGHALGQAIETAQQHTGLTHGEAVALGLLSMTRESERMGITARGTSERVERCMVKCGLPIETAADDRMMHKVLEGETVFSETALIERIGWCSVRRMEPCFLTDVWFGAAPKSIRPPLSI